VLTSFFFFLKLDQFSNSTHHMYVMFSKPSGFENIARVR